MKWYIQKFEKITFILDDIVSEQSKCRYPPPGIYKHRPEINDIIQHLDQLLDPPKQHETNIRGK